MPLNVHAKATSFAQEVQDLLDATLPALAGADPEQRRVRCLVAPSGHYAVHPGELTEASPVPLLSHGKHVANLRFRYHCTSDTRGTYLAVHKSSIELIGLGGGDNNAPIVRLDYLRDANKVPAAHWNVHAERGAVSHLLARCNPKHSGMLSKIHLSVGGARARPCMEDFLQMLFDEFGFDKLDGAKRALEAGRERWRRMQVATLVRDAPDEAVRALEELGYVITDPSNGAHSTNASSLRRY